MIFYDIFTNLIYNSIIKIQSQNPLLSLNWLDIFLEV